MSIVQKDIKKERESIHSHNFYYSILLLLYFTISYCYQSLPVLNHKLNFITSAYVQEKHSPMGFSTIPGFRHPLRVSEATHHR